MKIADKEVVVFKHLFHGTFWNGSKWIIPSTYEDLMQCHNCIMDKNLGQLCEDANADSFNCSFTTITVKSEFIF